MTIEEFLLVKAKIKRELENISLLENELAGYKLSIDTAMKTGHLTLQRWVRRGCHPLEAPWGRLLGIGGLVEKNNFSG